MTNELLNFLMNAGLTKQQATSITAETTVNALMGENEKLLIREARAEVQKMSEEYKRVYSDYRSVVSKIDVVAGLMKSVVEAQEKYGHVDDEKARTVIALTAALLKMFNDSGANSNQSAINTGYIVYAFLGGQAKIVTTGDDESGKSSNRQRF